MRNLSQIVELGIYLAGEQIDICDKTRGCAKLHFITRDWMAVPAKTKMERCLYGVRKKAAALAALTASSTAHRGAKWA